MATELGTLQRVELREVWQHEEYHFTPWLAETGNLAALSDAVGLDLELMGLEVAVGPYAADLVCMDAMSNTPVLIENQLAKTDHNHLGQILTYAAGLEAKTVIWVASRFTDEHRAAIDWLNEITHEDWQFFGLEIELWRIGASPPAPRFNVVCRPNDWSRAVREEAAKAEGNSPTRSFQLRFWTSFRDYRAERKQGAPKPSAQSWQSFRVGRTGFQLEGVVRHSEQKLAVRLYINCADLPIKGVFRYLEARQGEIHAALGFPLVWDELPEGKGSVVYVVRDNCPLDDEARWPDWHEWLSATIAKMDSVFRPLIRPLQPADLPPTDGPALVAPG
ncbi:DUF4268 domain-containing protein [Piscinibacter gummiphilus]|uniref:DUF4268 domain-containing protein n=1 Tax=Piscinibacter gummiphilus TaxID=946333 RepID=A0ABZ0CTH5_9BURK|nr:DUF4268 domain-containing protein [Piscinibacter gummiphilus]WOB08252.1 DUF4268 domain-containing protein [Piscinibacter gummiphilus]